MKKYSVDRIENGIAVIECGKEILNISVLNLPSGVREGDILVRQSDGSFTADAEETERLKREHNKIQNSLFDE